MKKLIERSITSIQPVTAKQHSPTHTSGLILEPGNWQAYDPFLLLAEDWFQKGTFPLHPHRGMETFTYVIEGILEHKDNKAGEGILYPGDAQFMTAGKGVLHSEDPLEGETVHSLQLWLNLPSAFKMTEPRYQNLRSEDMPVRRETGAVAKVFSGSSAGVTAETENYVPFTMVEMTIEPGAKLTQDIPADYNGFFYVLSGRVIIGSNRKEAAARDVVWMGKVDAGVESEIHLEAIEPSKVLFYAGKPLNEPVVARGPFVMNTEEDIYQAYADYRNGKFEQ